MAEQDGGEAEAPTIERVDRELRQVRHDVTNLGERIDALKAAVHAMRESRPDITTSLQTIAALLDGLRSQGTDTRADVERLTDEVASVAARAGRPGPDLDRLPDLLDGIAQRLDISSTESAQVRDRIDGFLEAVADLRRELASADDADDGDVALVLNRIDQVGQQMGRAGQQQTERLDQVAALLGQQVTASGTLEQALLSIRAELTERLDQIARRTGEPEAAAAGRVADGLRTELTSRLDALDERLVEQGTALAAAPSIGEAEARIREQLESVAAAVAAEQAQLHAVREATDGALQLIRSDVAARAEELRNDLRQLAEDVEQRLAAPIESVDLSPVLAALDAGVSDLRSLVTPSEEVRGQLAILDELRATVGQLAQRVDAAPQPPAPSDVAAAVAEVLSGSLATTISPIVADQAEIANHVDEVTAAVAELGSTVAALAARPDPPAPLARSDVADAVAEVLTGSLDRAISPIVAATAELTAQVQQAVTATSSDLTARVDEMRAAVAALADRVAGAVAAADLDAAIELITEDLGSQRAQLQTSLAGVEAALTEVRRSDREVVTGAVAAATAGVSQRIDGAVSGLLERLDALAAVMSRDVDDLRQQLAAMGDASDIDWGPAHDELRRAVQADLRAAVEPLRADVTQASAASDAARDDLRAALDAALEALRNQMGRSREDAAAMRESVRTELDGLREALTAQAQPPDVVTAADLDDAIGRAVAGLGASIETLQAAVGSAADAPALRDALAAAVERVLGRVNADANRVLDTVASGEGALRDQLRKVDGGLTEIRRDLEQLGRVSDAIDALSVTTRQSAVPERLVTSVADLQRDLNTVRDEVIAVTRVVGGLRAELRQGDGAMGGAGAALVASAAAAMARLEARLDHEFEVVTRHMESLGTLVHQAVEAIDALEDHRTQPAAAAPVGERLRATASSFLESLRAAGRERAARRSRGSGPRSLNP